MTLDSLRKYSTELNTLVYAFANNPCPQTQDALQRFIVEDCYQHRRQAGEFSGGKSGSLAFDICPKQDHGTSESAPTPSQEQHDHFQNLIEKINQALHVQLRHLGKPQSDFVWQGSTRFQMKFDSTRPIDFNPVREELNENIAELVVTCISDELQNHNPNLDLADHPNAIIFADEHNNTIIASQYLTHTIGTLSGFISECIHALRTIDVDLARQYNLDIDLDKLKNRYRNFDLHSDQEISFIDEKQLDNPVSFSKHPGKFMHNLLNRNFQKDQQVVMHDLDQLASLYALSKNHKNPDKELLELHQPLLKKLLDEISFSHVIADHDVNPGNFVARQVGKDITLSRIDFGMANYHFTRGRIYGLSRRPFKNIFLDIKKESLHDFVCRKKIGFGLGVFLTLVDSKISRHLTAVKRLFKKPHDQKEASLVQSTNQLNARIHTALSQPAAQKRISDAFMKKIEHLPHSARIDIVRDLKLMQLQSIRTSYLDFSTLRKSGLSVLKLIGMLSLTPILACCRLAYSPLVALSRFAPDQYHLTNSIPLTTWTLVHTIKLQKTLNFARKDALQCNHEIIKCLDKVLVNLSFDNKHYLSDTEICEMTHTSMHSHQISDAFEQKSMLNTSRPSLDPLSEKQILSSKKK